MKNIFNTNNVFLQLQNNFKKGILSHAYLFVSPDEMTNSYFAKAISKTLLCDNKNSCDTCPSCFKISANSHPDILAYPKGTSFVVDDANDINLHALERPMISDKKIIIINNIDLSTVQAQNKILKTLEEPPKSVIFLLTAVNENKILPTIISRTRKIRVGTVSKDNIKNYILQSRKADETILSKALKYGEGWLGKTINVLDNLRFLQKEELAKEIVFNFTSSKNLSAVSSKVISYKDDLKTILELVAKEFNKILISSEDNYTKEGAVKIIEDINIANQNLERNVNVNLIVDNLLMKILETKYQYQMQIRSLK